MTRMMTPALVPSPRAQAPLTAMMGARSWEIRASPLVIPVSP
jgi:hypothetical protein